MAAPGIAVASIPSRLPRWAGLRSPPRSSVGGFIVEYASRRGPSRTIASQSSICRAACARSSGANRVIKSISFMPAPAYVMGQSRSFDQTTGDLIVKVAFNDGSSGLVKVTFP